MKEKFLKVWNAIKKNYEDVFSNFPVTLIAIFVTTAVFFAALVAGEGVLAARVVGGSTTSLGEILLTLKYVLIYVAVAIAACESCLNKTASKKVCAVWYCAAGILGVAVAFLNTSWCPSDVKKIIGGGYIDIISAGFIVVCIALFIFFACQKQSVTLGEYAIRTFAKAILYYFVYGVIMIGIVLLLLIFTELIAGEFFEIFEPVMCLLTGLYCAPMTLIIFGSEGEAVSAFFKNVVTKVMLVLAIIGCAIIYIYMLKILITMSIPSNSIFVICTALFCAVIPISLMCTAYENEGLMQRIAYLMPYIFAPFIILQGYAVIVRVAQYGLTVSRYLGLAMIIFEIIYIVIYACMRNKIKNIFLIIAIMAFVTTICPVINAYSLSKMVTDQTGATGFGSDDLFDEYATDDEPGTLATYDYFEIYNVTLPEGISKMQSVIVPEWSTDPITHMPMYANDDTFYYPAGDEESGLTPIMYIDTSELCKKAMDDRENQFRNGKNYMIRIDDEHYYIVNSIMVEYKEDDLSPVSMETTGYLLTK